MLLILLVLAAVTPATAETLRSCAREGRATGPTGPSCGRTISPGFYRYAVSWTTGATGDAIVTIDEVPSGSFLFRQVCEVRAGRLDHCRASSVISAKTDTIDAWSTVAVIFDVETNARISFSVQAPFCDTTCTLPPVALGSFEYHLTSTDPF